MDQQTPILQKIGEAVALIKLLQQERDEAIARSQMLMQEKDDAVAQSQTLKQENEQMKALMALTESKLDEILVVRTAHSN